MNLGCNTVGGKKAYCSNKMNAIGEVKIMSIFRLEVLRCGNETAKLLRERVHRVSGARTRVVAEGDAPGAPARGVAGVVALGERPVRFTLMVWGCHERVCREYVRDSLA